MTLVRASDATQLNEVVNHSSVWPHVARQGQDGNLDLSPVVADPRNVVLTCPGGALVFVWMEAGVFEVHTQFVDGHRGPEAVAATKEALEWMFTRSEAMELYSQVPVGNVGALGLVRAIGGKRWFSRENAWTKPDGVSVGVDYYCLHYNDWMARAGGLVERGAWFHRELVEQKAKVGFPGEAPHPDDLAHDRAVGACAAMIVGGQIPKGINLYNRWAKFAGYGEIRVVSLDPLLLDIMDCFLWVKPDGGFEVMPCH